MMSTFGEIVEPVSRAAWEDWDDLTTEENGTMILWQQPPEKLTVQTLIILEGKYLCDVLKDQRENKLKLINSTSKSNIRLYNLMNTQKYVCIIKEYDLVISSDIVELLRPILTTANEVISVQTKSLNEYKTMEEINSNCIMRMLYTTQTSQKLDFDYPKLEQPNIIAGVSAGVITLREHLDLSGTAVVCYVQCPEEYQVDEVGNLLNQLNITPAPSSRPNSVLNSNLYL